MATLTIADLDNGKRDLETVDAVANSQADTTTTRYGQQTLTLAGSLRRLGWQSPVPYAPGLSVNSPTMTVEKDGIVYRPDPALVPFTTGAWDPDQWRVLQNDTMLRSDLAQSSGASLIGYSADGEVLRTVAEKLADAVNVKDFGVIYTQTYDKTIAQRNKTLLEGLMRDVTVKSVIFPPDSKTLFVCGSVHPLRDDLVIWHQHGCNIVGYEEDAGISWAGHLFGFVKYSDPDIGDFNVTGQIKNITYILDGNIATDYSPSQHGVTFNNNAIGAYYAKSCYVIGRGGVSQSSHDGINFDGNSDDCHVDISYCNQFSTVGIQMLGSVGSFNSVRVTSMYSDRLDDTVNQPTARSMVIVGGGDSSIYVNRIETTKGVPTFNAQRARSVNIKFDSLKGAGAHIVRMYATKSIKASGTYSNMNQIVAVAGVEADRGIFESIALEGITCNGADTVQTSSLVNPEILPTAFKSLRISGCDFSVNPSFASLCWNLPVPYFSEENNIFPDDFGYNNLLAPVAKSKVIASYGDETASFKFYDKFGIIRKINMSLVLAGGSTPRWLNSMDVTPAQASEGATYKIFISPTVGEVTLNISAGTVTMTAPAGYVFAYALGEYL